MKPLDVFRCQILSYLSRTNSFSRSWNQFSLEIDRFCGTSPTSTQIFELGDHLSSVFQSNSTGRNQSTLSGGGTAWECLITWYLNLIFWGTDVIASRQNQNFIPRIIYDALCVTISNRQTNTESDVVVYNVPDPTNLNIELTDINDLISNDIKKVDLSVVQCKTNWNDNSQIPMLWDLIYNSSSFRIPNVSVGRNGVSPGSFGKFGYAFVTVPTVTNPLQPHQVAVLRVVNLTGGNYWGKKTESGVASSLNEFFGRNYTSHFVGGVQTHINNQLLNDPDYYTRFRNLTF